MPTIRAGLPYCTPWKNYHLGFKQLTENNGGLSDVATTGIFNTRPLTIYINDDWPCHAPMNDWYQITATSSGGAIDFLNKDNSNPLKSNRYWFDGVKGQKSAWPDTGCGQLGRQLKLKNADNELFFNDTVNQQAVLDLGVLTVDHKTPIFTLEPGLHFGTSKILNAESGTGDKFAFKIDTTYIKNLPKVYDGSATCWFELPAEATDEVYTDPLPANMLGHRGWSLATNPIRFVPKKDGEAVNLMAITNYNLGIILQSRNAGGEWVDDVALSTDIDPSAIGNHSHHMNYLITGSAGQNIQGEEYRFKIIFNNSPGSAFHKMQRAQYIMMAIVPL